MTMKKTKPGTRFNPHLPAGMTVGPFPEQDKHLSPVRMLAIIIATTFVTETIIMFILELILRGSLPSLIGVFETMVDSTSLTIVIFPALYFLAFRPLVSYKESLKQSYNLLEKTFASLAEAVLVVDSSNSMILTCNSAVKIIIGYSREDIVGRSNDILFADHDQYQAMMRRYADNAEQSAILRDEIEMRHRDGHHFIAEITMTNMPDETDRQQSQVIVIRDITERRKAEQQLRVQTAALEAAANGIVITNPDGIIEWANATFSNMTGYDRDSVIGQNMDLLKSGQHDSIYYAQMWQTIRAGEIWSGEIINKHNDGHLYPEEQTIAPVRDDNGRISHFVAIKQDITERKKTEAQLERQNQELRALSHLGQAAVSSLEMTVVLNQVIGQMIPLLRAECLSVFLLEGSELVCRATGGDNPDDLSGLRLPAHTKLQGHVIETGESTLVSTPDNICIFDEPTCRVICHDYPKALMLVPLKVGQDTIGLLQVAHRQPDVFTIDDLNLLQSAADWAAIAINHARQHEEIQRRMRETAALAAINQSLNETLDLDSILQLIADSMPKLIAGVDRVVIHLLQNDEGLLHPVIWSGQSHLDTPVLYLNPSEGIAGQALKTGRLVNVPDVNQDPNFISNPASPQIKSLMVAPLQSGRQQLGTISIHNAHRKKAFSATDEKLLMRLADSASVTISTANLYQAERTQRQFAEKQVQVATALSLSLNLDDVLQTVLDQALRIVISGEKASVFLLKDGDVYLTQSTDDQALPKQLPEALRRIFNAEDTNHSPPQQLIAATGKPILITETENEPPWPNEPGVDWLKSLVAAPLRIRYEIIGFLNVHSTRPGAFDQNTIRQLEALAAHASLAIHNATLFNELKAALQKEQSTRAQLVQAQKLSAMGRMVASVAHELNNPLQTIKNCLFISRKRIDVSNYAHKYLEMAFTETERLSNLVMQLREVYRPDTRVTAKPFSLLKTLQTVSLLLEPHLQRNNVQWQQPPDLPDCQINGIAGHLQQVFLNISLNAIEAMQPNGGEIYLTLVPDEKNQRVGVQIRDTGPGISPEDISHLFDPFFTTKESGTGLGLAICYDIVKNHGGEITVENASQGGAIFTIWLPHNEHRNGE
jgi:PAS domain S-box-containing protein